jgi:alcohol dehydrogenase class IV
MNPFDFEFTTPPKIVFGWGKITKLADLATPLGKSAFVVYNGKPPDRAVEILKSANLRHVLHRQRGEPTVTDVESALQTAKQNQCDMVIAIGGGSAIDCGKAVAGLLTNDGAVLDYLEVIGKGRKITKPAAPWIAIPTTAGTGSEATRNAVIGSPEHKYKASLRSEHLLAKVALIDPQLGVDVPAHVRAASGMDALVQCIESFTSSGANEMTRPLSLQGISLTAHTLRTVSWPELPVRIGGASQGARLSMATVALLGGIALSNAGLGAVHGLAAPLGANTTAPHGLICGVLLPHVLRANIAAILADRSGGLLLYKQVGQRLSSKSTMETEEAVEACPTIASELVRDLKLPPLSQFGLTESMFPQIIEMSKKSSSMRYNPVPLADETLAHILRAVL